MVKSLPLPQERLGPGLTRDAVVEVDVQVQLGRRLTINRRPPDNLGLH